MKPMNFNIYVSLQMSTGEYDSIWQWWKNPGTLRRSSWSSIFTAPWPCHVKFPRISKNELEFSFSVGWTILNHPKSLTFELLNKHMENKLSPGGRTNQLPSSHQSLTQIIKDGHDSWAHFPKWICSWKWCWVVSCLVGLHEWLLGVVVVPSVVG